MKKPFLKKLLECNVSDLERKKKYWGIIAYILLILFALGLIAATILYQKNYYFTCIIVLILSITFYFISLDCANEREKLSLWIFLKQKLGE